MCLLETREEVNARFHRRALMESAAPSGCHEKPWRQNETLPQRTIGSHRQPSCRETVHTKPRAIPSLTVGPCVGMHRPGRALPEDSKPCQRPLPRVSRHFQALPGVSGHCQGFPRKRAVRVAPCLRPCSMGSRAGRMEAFRPRALRADVFSTAERRFSMAQRRLGPWVARCRMGQAPFVPFRSCALPGALGVSGCWAFPGAALRTGGHWRRSDAMSGPLKRLPAPWLAPLLGEGCHLVGDSGGGQMPKGTLVPMLQTVWMGWRLVYHDLCRFAVGLHRSAWIYGCLYVGWTQLNTVEHS